MLDNSANSTINSPIGYCSSLPVGRRLVFRLLGNFLRKSDLLSFGHCNSLKREWDAKKYHISPTAIFAFQTVTPPILLNRQTARRRRRRAGKFAISLDASIRYGHWPNNGITSRRQVHLFSTCPFGACLLLLNYNAQVCGQEDHHHHLASVDQQSRPIR